MAEIGEDVYSADAYSSSAAIVPSRSLSPYDTIARVPLFDGIFGDLSKIRPYSAIGNSSPLNLKFSKHHTVLQLKGLIFGKIQILSNALLVENTCADAFRLLPKCGKDAGHTSMGASQPTRSIAGQLSQTKTSMEIA